MNRSLKNQAVRLRFTFLLLPFFIIVAGCADHNAAPQQNDKKNNDTLLSAEATECDSLKFPDFKNNLTALVITQPPAFTEQIDSIANDFRTRQCDADRIYCGEMFLKHQRLYTTETGQEVFSFGYAFPDSAVTLEYEESAGFFVFGIFTDGKITFYDIVEDMLGEVRFTLAGFETNGTTTIIWGERYLYFPDSAEYGKFKLTINGKNSSWEFECDPMLD